MPQPSWAAPVGLCLLLASSAAAAAEPVEVVAAVLAGLPAVARVVPLTRGPKHHFVGYYGITPWDAAGRRVACLRADVGDRLVAAGDRAAVGLADAASGAVEPVAETAAWNLQQGAMLHWLATAPDRQLVFNDRVDGRLVSVVLDVATGTRRLTDRPVAAIAPDGRSAVGLNFDRLRQIRPVTGYAGGPAAAGPPDPRPADDGLFAVDMTTGRSRLLVSVDECCRLAGVPPAVAAQPVWLEHPVYSRDGSRLFLLARAFHPTTRGIVSVPLVARADGTGLRPLLPWAAGGASHFDWLDADRVAVTREVEPRVWRHLLLGGGEPPGGRVLAGDVLTRDGHCTFSPDGRWMVTDTYPDEGRRQHLYVMEVATGRAARVASFHAPPGLRGDWRCDLHPRWDRESRRVCVDSAHDGRRQVYVVELRMP